MTRRFDPRLILVTGSLAGGRSLEATVAAAVRGGVTAVQLRDKAAPDDDLISFAIKLKSLLEPRGVPLLINDRVRVAAAAGAAGVHLGQDDASVSETRRFLGPGALIGLSIGTPGQAAAAEDLDLDYYGVSPVFATPTKPDAGTPWGLDGLRELRLRTRRALVAIGGINAANAAAVLEAGADGLAVVSAICAAEDPEAAARSIRAVIDETLRFRRGGS